MLLDNVAQCATRNKGCQKAFLSPGASEHRDRTPMCGPCRETARQAIVAVLRGERPFSAMKPIKVTVGFMLSRRSGWAAVFADHAESVDDALWSSWWREGVVGGSRETWLRFVSHILENYSRRLPEPHQGATGKIEIPEGLDVPAPPPEPEKAVKHPEVPAAEEAPAEKPEPKKSRAKARPKTKRQRKAAASIHDAPAKGAVVEISPSSEADIAERQFLAQAEKAEEGEE